MCKIFIFKHLLCTVFFFINKTNVKRFKGLVFNTCVIKTLNSKQFNYPCVLLFDLIK
jgi:hypothetical protein